MTMIHCEECGHQISSRASACPSCGFPVPEDAENRYFASKAREDDRAAFATIESARVQVEKETFGVWDVNELQNGRIAAYDFYQLKLRAGDTAYLADVLSHEKQENPRTYPHRIAGFIERLQDLRDSGFIAFLEGRDRETVIAAREWENKAKENLRNDRKVMAGQGWQFSRFFWLGSAIVLFGAAIGLAVFLVSALIFSESPRTPMLVARVSIGILLFASGGRFAWRRARI